MRTVLVVVLSIALAHAAMAQSDWKKTWDDTLVAARKEGKVVVAGSPDPVMRNQIIPKFTALYGIQIDFVAGRSSQIISKVRLERAAGQYLVDVYMSGAGTTFFTLLPEKMLDPLQPLLIHADVTDGARWKRGKPWFVDDGGNVLMLFSSVQSLLFINTNHVKQDELRSVHDLLNPKWAGKISSEDPLGRAGGGGAGSSLHWFHELGADFMRKLHFGQKTTVSGDRRQMVDWLAQGKYPIYMNETSTAELLAIVGGLSKPSKMPGFAYGLSAHDCKVGSLLRKVKGSTCGSCYALKAMYSFPVVKKAHARRLESLSDPRWIPAMSELIARKSKKIPFFRWHDSGDIQSVEHLSKIVQIAKNVPHVTFWIPTRETAIVKEWLAENPSGFPSNLTVRVSAPMIGRNPEKIAGTVGSSVENPSAFQCPAPKQGNSCQECRSCWNPKVEEVSYSKH